MKTIYIILHKLIFIFSILLISHTVFSQGWFIFNTFSPAQSLQTIRFYDANTGYTTAPVYGGSTMEIHKTTNGGQSWTDQDAGYTGERFMAIWIVHPDTVYISGNDGHILKTVNGGLNWVTIGSDTLVQLWGLQFVNSFTGYAAGSNGTIIKTTDAGASWFPQASGVPNALSCVYFRNENTGYVSGFAVVVKTTNAGANWVNLNAPFVNGFENFAQITFTDDNTGYYISGLGRIEKTTNAGTNWTLLPGITSEQYFGIYFTDPNTAYVCGFNGSIIKTTNAGAAWTSQVSPLNEILTGIWFTTPLTGFISTWSGKVLKTTNGGVTFIAPVSSEVPKDFSLSQNYPNPFNPMTNIEFDIPLLRGVSGGRGVSVHLKIYDTAGNEIAVLVNDNLTPGKYRVTWNASDYASGVYFYKLITGNLIETKRMVLVK
jgi:photosystem II stability/assembly factor-like uncharacterized protein